MTPDQARRALLRAQGLGARPQPGTVGGRQVLAAVRRLRVVQLDSVNVVARAHYLPLFARLGAYPREELDALAWSPRRRRLVEYWAHEASLLPVEDWPLLRWRMREHGERPGWFATLLQRSPRILDEVLALFAEHGPMEAGEVNAHLGGPGRGAGQGWWEWSDAKRACEYLFAAGRITVATRQGFRRHYDLVERVLPAAVHAAPVPARGEAVRTLVERSAAALGVGTAADLRDYWRLPAADTRTAITELVAQGTLLPVAVAGWPDPAWRHHAATVPRRVAARALLGPFDPLVWDRARTLRQFGFHYRIGLYTPAAQRTHGYYVFPFLLDEALVARVDLKADRAAGLLIVRGAYAEPGADHGRVAAELAAELRAMASWLGLESVSATGAAGDLSDALLTAVSRPAS